jgi:hypothetical protein
LRGPIDHRVMLRAFSGLGLLRRSPPVTETVAFVLCIERNAMRDQALLLIESIRAFAGAHRNAPIWAVASRPGLGVDRPTRTKLEALEVNYFEGPLNVACPEYGSANRVYAAAWVAGHTSATTLIVLDSDTLMLDEPELLGPSADVAVRPVDFKGTTTTGSGDAFDPYWVSLCALGGASIDILPFVKTTVDRCRVRASYNGGYAVVRRGSGILELTAEIFTRSVKADLRPRYDCPRMFASTGFVSPLASEYWGSTQAAFAVSTWSTTRRVRHLDTRYNVPLHALTDKSGWRDPWAGVRPVHVHYHWMLYPEHSRQALGALKRLGVPPERMQWIGARVPLDDADVARR